VGLFRSVMGQLCVTMSLIVPKHKHVLTFLFSFYSNISALIHGFFDHTDGVFLYLSNSNALNFLRVMSLAGVQ